VAQSMELNGARATVTSGWQRAQIDRLASGIGGSALGRHSLNTGDGCHRSRRLLPALQWALKGGLKLRTRFHCCPPSQNAFHCWQVERAPQHPMKWKRAWAHWAHGSLPSALFGSPVTPSGASMRVQCPSTTESCHFSAISSFPALAFTLESSSFDLRTHLPYHLVSSQ